MLRIFGFALLLMLLIRPAAAQEAGEELRSEEWPLSSVGRVNVVYADNRRAHCTATVIAPNLVLTAAHCLYDRPRGRWVDPSSVHFVAGYSKGKYLAHSVASSFDAANGLVPPEKPQVQFIVHDFAVLVLAKPVELQPIPIRYDEWPDAIDVVRAGYRADRQHLITVQHGCSASNVDPKGLFVVRGCKSAQGESGSAILQFENGQPRIAGILVASSTAGDLQIALHPSVFASVIKREGMPAK